MSGRIRTIKPEILEDDVACSMSDAAWRLWVSSWTLADDHGNLRASARYLAAQVWQDTGRDVQPIIDELIACGRFEPYAVNGQRYVHIKNWEKHQRVDNAGKERVPRPDSDDGSWGTSSPRLAESLREPPRVSANLGDSPLRARAPSPTSDPDHDPEEEGGPADPAASPPRPSGVTRSASRPRPRREPGGPHPLPDTWSPRPEDVARFAAEGWDALGVVDNFRDHWAAERDKPKGKKSDWDAAFRTWVRRSVQYNECPEYVRPPPLLTSTPPGSEPDTEPASPEDVARLLGSLDRDDDPLVTSTFDLVG